MPINTPENRRLARLLGRVALRDHAAFRQFYDLTSGHLYGVAVRIVHPRAAADEVLRDTYIRVWDHAADYCPASAVPLAWLLTMLRHTARKTAAGCASAGQR